MARKLFTVQVLGDEEFIKEHPPRGCSNLRLLEKRSGIKYDNLVRIFTRKGSFFYISDRVVIMKIYEGDIERGGQRVSRRGRGGVKFNGSGYNRGY